MTATPAIVDFSWEASLSWPDSEQYEPETSDQVAEQEAIRSARAQGLPDRIQDPAVIGRLATMLRRGRD